MRHSLNTSLELNNYEKKLEIILTSGERVIPDMFVKVNDYIFAMAVYKDDLYVHTSKGYCKIVDEYNILNKD